MKPIEKICISCPVGCHLSIEMNDGALLVKGNACPRGVDYARIEMTQPKRMVTTTVALTGASINRLPVKTDRPLDKDKVLELCKVLRTVTFNSPVNCGEVLITEILGTDVNIVSTRSVQLADKVIVV